ncbi:MAG: hypothetical protein M1132_08885 [Chloroflexi bacterium]|nr:hypothetical protein [Chloroflexota bacterium]MCL5951822.1 hypothetical protein [Chloroflexota bacterium]
MEINLGDEEIINLQTPFTTEQLEDKVLAKRMDAFGQMAKFIQRPKLEDIEITARQKRLEPFWYAVASARYAYERRHSYEVNVAPEVQSVTVYGNAHPVPAARARAFSLEGVESCLEEFRQELTLDAIRGNDVKMDKYLSFPQAIVPDATTLGQNGTLVIAPEVRSSFVVRKLIASLMKTFQADRILEEKINVEKVALCYRPVFAVEYLWKAKDKRQVLEFDGLTGDAKAESGEIKKHVVRVLENDALFDIGADVVGTFFPGVNVAVKVGRFAARKAIK